MIRGDSGAPENSPGAIEWPVLRLKASTSSIEINVNSWSGSIVVGESADANSRFAATSYGITPKINGSIVEPETNPLFL